MLLQFNNIFKLNLSFNSFVLSKIKNSNVIDV